MKPALFLLLLLLFATAVWAFYRTGIEQGALLLVIFSFSVRAYLVAETYLKDRDKEEYDRQMKGVQTFTIVCAFISFYWPDSMFQNAAIFFCLIFHAVLGRYVRLNGE